MATVERTVTTSTPLPVVWEYLTDFTNASEWDPPTVSCEVIEGDGGVGTRYRNVSGLLGYESEVIFEVVERAPLQTFRMHGDAGKSLQLTDTITFSESANGHTEVTYHAIFDLQGGAAVAEPLSQPALKLLANRVAASLQENLDRLTRDG